MHKKEIQTAGKDINEAKKVLILLHGRGATAKNILDMAPHLHLENFTFIAPQATKNTWYPYSFLAPQSSNEPWLSSALEILKDLLEDLLQKGFSSKKIYLLGFSQGACLCLEFAARNAHSFGGIVAFTGGLIGEDLNMENYRGNFKETPVYISTGDPDPHVPVERVEASARILKDMNAAVKVEIYRNRPHSISEDEMKWAQEYIFK